PARPGGHIAYRRRAARSTLAFSPFHCPFTETVTEHLFAQTMPRCLELTLELLRQKDSGWECRPPRVVVRHNRLARRGRDVARRPSVGTRQPSGGTRIMLG